MFDVTVELQDKNVAGVFDALHGPELTERLDLAAEMIGALIVGRAKSKAPVGATQVLRNTIAARQFAWRGHPAVMVGSPAPYAYIIHNGRKPGSRPPPPEALHGWLKFKGLPISLAFVVARNIGLRGIVGRPFLEEAITESIPQMEQIFRSVVPEGFQV